MLWRRYCAMQKVSPRIWVKGPIRPPMVKNPVMACEATSRREGRDRPDEPSIVLFRTIATQQVVVAVNGTARERHIKHGMTLAQARAIDSELIHDEHEPSRDAKAVEALARWMMRFSPVVCLPLTGGEGIFLDITGCERVFKGMPNLIRQLRVGMERFQISCAITVAPTPGAAWALSYSKKCQDRVISPDEMPEAIHPLPPMTLRLPGETVKVLHHLGLTTIVQLEAMPRDSLPSRFGSLLLTRLDQAFGRIAEPLVPLEPFAPIEAKREFDGAVAALEPLWITLRELIDLIMRELLKRNRGARTVEAEFLRESTPPLHRTIRLSRPSRDGRNLFNLLRCTLENLGEEARGNKRRSDGATERRRERRYVDRDGFVGMRLVVSVSEPLSDEQITLLGQEEHQGQIEVDRWIERLTVRLGAECLTKPRLHESHLPERAFERLHAASEHGREPDFSSDWKHLSRPLLLLHTPRELKVTVSPSHDRNGRPIQFIDTGRLHRLVHAIGPERIAGQWWENHHKTRDYFEVEDETGKRFWIFRVTENGRWFVQGEYS